MEYNSLIRQQLNRADCEVQEVYMLVEKERRHEKGKRSSMIWNSA